LSENLNDDHELATSKAIFRRGSPNESTNRKVGLQDFELISVLGRGSFGKTMKVCLKDDPAKTPLAMKVIRRDALVKEEKPEKVVPAALQIVTHPFVATLMYAFQTKDRLYLILDFAAVSGGEIFFLLKEQGCFSPSRTKLYIAELASALQHLHSMGIVYRDLKPDNIILDKNGHACLLDFGLMKTDGSKSAPSFTFSGTPEYLAPEILRGKGHSRGVDWWALGVIMYEFLCGLPPFYSEDVNEMYEFIISKPLAFPDHITPDARDLISQWLQREEDKRLIDGAKVRAHPFFKDIDWQRLDSRAYPPEFVPDTNDQKFIADEFKNEMVGTSAIAVVAQMETPANPFNVITFVSQAKPVL